jgi:hypothetical protein
MKEVVIILLFLLAGFAKGIADRISWGDWFGKYKFWSRDYTGIKDKNNDSKVSAQEQYFPFDGWHLMEWARIIFPALAIAIFIQLENPAFDNNIINRVNFFLCLVGAFNIGFLFIYYGILPKLKRRK